MLLQQDDHVDETAKALLQQAFMDRMPSNIRQILSVFDNESLDFLASKVDALISNQQQYPFPQDDINSSQSIKQTLHNLTTQVQHLTSQFASLQTPRFSNHRSWRSEYFSSFFMS